MDYRYGPLVMDNQMFWTMGRDGTPTPSKGMSGIQAPRGVEIGHECFPLTAPRGGRPVGEGVAPGHLKSG